MRYQAVIFDLDGTLLDTLEDLADSMNAALQGLGYPAHPIADYRYFVGDGIREMARRVLPASHRNEETVELTVKKMFAEYDRRWKVKTVPYPGICEMLDALTKAGLPMAVLSNKPDPFTKIMVPALLPGWKFSPVFGARPEVPIKPDPQAALEIAATLGVAPERFLYLGDTGTDMQTASAAGMHAVGVTWGFRQEEELVENGAKTILRKPEELMKRIGG